MKAIVRSQSALARKSQSSAEPVDSPEYTAERDASVSSVNLRAVRRPGAAQPSDLMGDDPTIDYAKLRRLRAAIGAGTWKLDSTLIAERVIDDAE